jgi:hypothetical protein
MNESDTITCQFCGGRINREYVETHMRDSHPEQWMKQHLSKSFSTSRAVIQPRQQTAYRVRAKLSCCDSAGVTFDAEDTKTGDNVAIRVRRLSTVYQLSEHKKTPFDAAAYPAILTKRFQALANCITSSRSSLLPIIDCFFLRKRHYPTGLPWVSAGLGTGFLSYPDQPTGFYVDYETLEEAPHDSLDDQHFTEAPEDVFFVYVILTKSHLMHLIPLGPAQRSVFDVIPAGRDSLWKAIRTLHEGRFFHGTTTISDIFKLPQGNLFLGGYDSVSECPDIPPGGCGCAVQNFGNHKQTCPMHTRFREELAQLDTLLRSRMNQK